MGNHGIAATAQITILAVDDVKKSEPIDELVFRAQYELKMVEDTTKADRQPNSETMMLEVGKKCSQFYSYTYLSSGFYFDRRLC